MRRIHQFIHVAKITAASKLRIANLGRPNIELEIPGPQAIDLPESSQALYVTISAKVLDAAVAREGKEILRSCMKREYSLIILDMRMVQTADSHGLRWLARLKQTVDWYNVSLQTQIGPSLALVLKLSNLAPELLHHK
jgi:hypothetical protein